MEHLLRLRRPGRLAVRRLVGVQRVRYLARGVLPSAAVVGGVALLFLLLQRNRPEDVGHPPVEPQAASEAVRYAGFRPEGGNGGSLQVLAKAVRNRTVLCLGLAYFLLKPARYAILLWGPVIVYERMPALGKVGAAIVPTAFEVAGLLGPILIGFASDKLFGARRMPACVISLLALTVCLALFVPAMTTGSIPIVVGLLFMMGLTLYGPDSMICRLRRHRLRHQRGRRHRLRLRQWLRFGGRDPRRSVARLFRHLHGVHRLHHRSPDRHGGAPPALEQPARRRTGKPAEYPQPGGLPSHPLLTVRGGNLRRVLLHEPGTLMHIERFEVVKRRAEMALHGNTVYIGGQVADDPSGDIQDQTRQILENIDRLLQSVGSDRGQVLSVRILLAHREDYAGLNQVWDQWFPRRPGADPRL